MQRNIAETILGAAVLVVAAGFLVYFSRTAELSSNSSSYVIKANFSKIDGLDAGSPVKISGVKVGQVLDYSLDPVRYNAIVRISIDNAVKLPSDTAAVISSAGLLDGKFLSLIPGVDDEEMMKAGDVITQTQAAPSLEELLGKYIFSMSKDKESDEKTSAP